MSLASAFAFSAALIVLYVASFHAWIYWQRRQEREHLWLAVTAAGIAGFGVTAALLYSARTVEEGVYWQRVMFLTSCPLLVGFLRFSFYFLDVERPLASRVGLAFTASVALIAGGSDLVFTGEAVERHVPLFGPGKLSNILPRMLGNSRRLALPQAQAPHQGRAGGD